MKRLGSILKTMSDTRLSRQVSAAPSNKPINADSQKLRSFVAPLFAAGYGER